MTHLHQHDTRATARRSPVYRDLAVSAGALFKQRDKALILRIVALVMERYDIDSVGWLFGERRQREIVIPRHMAMGLCHAICRSFSYAAIGRYFGDRDHTTIRSACARHKQRMADPEYAAIARSVLEEALNG